MSAYQFELGTAMRAAREAGNAILAIFESASVRTKPDGSFVTDADLASDRIIREIVTRAFPDDAILTEEGVDDRVRLDARRCWIVDPIDGTAAFVAREADFDVYIALVVDHRPVVAVTLQPVTGLQLSAVVGEGAWIERTAGQRERLRYAEPGGQLRIGTRPWLGSPENLPLLERVANAVGPHASVVDAKVGLNVRSFLPPYPLVDAMVGLRSDGIPLDAWEWDIAAVDLIVREAGGCATDTAGNSLQYNKEIPRIGNLILSSNCAVHELLLRELDDALLDNHSLALLE
jgi:3'-phosphoadenosine 5'-phosphosulfate (PAPS) 3'-phosphatase